MRTTTFGTTLVVVIYYYVIWTDNQRRSPEAYTRRQEGNYPMIKVLQDCILKLSFSRVYIWMRTRTTHVEECRLSSITARTILIFISVMDVCNRPSFFSHSGASFTFFKNVECLFCIIDSAIHSNSYAFLNNLIIILRQFVKMNAMLMCC